MVRLFKQQSLKVAMHASSSEANPLEGFSLASTVKETILTSSRLTRSLSHRILKSPSLHIRSRSAGGFPLDNYVTETILTSSGLTRSLPNRILKSPWQLCLHSIGKYEKPLLQVCVVICDLKLSTRPHLPQGKASDDFPSDGIRQRFPLYFRVFNVRRFF